MEVSATAKCDKCKWTHTMSIEVDDTPNKRDHARVIGMGHMLRNALTAHVQEHHPEQVPQ